MNKQKPMSTSAVERLLTVILPGRSEYDALRLAWQPRVERSYALDGGGGWTCVRWDGLVRVVYPDPADRAPFYLRGPMLADRLRGDNIWLVARAGIKADAGPAPGDVALCYRACAPGRRPRLVAECDAEDGSWAQRLRIDWRDAREETAPAGRPGPPPLPPTWEHLPVLSACSFGSSELFCGSPDAMHPDYDAVS